jgi:dolichyl-diphosphooligosaccharide--protein glycosyltransferase
LERSTAATDLGMLSTVGELTRVRPLTHAFNWWFAALLGGTRDAAATVAAWQPIVTSVLLVLVLYGLVVTLTGDHRVASATGLLLAMTPAHAVYTGLGFLEHRSYQYFWLLLLAASLAWLAVDCGRRLAEDSQSGQEERAAVTAHATAPRSWAVAGVLALAVAASAHAWGGSPLTFVPVAAYFAIRVVQDTRRSIPALQANAPALGGVVVGSGLAVLAHVQWGWHDSIAATVPALVALGAVAVAVLATAWLRLDRSVGGLLATEALILGVGGVLFALLRPGDISRLQERSDALFGRNTAVETMSLFNADQFVIFGPLAQIGIGFYLALLPLGAATYYVYREYDPGWLVVTCFGWYYLVLAAIQARFTAQFAIFCAIFGGAGLVSLLSAVELARRPSLFDRDGSLTGPPLQLPDTPAKGGYLAGVIIAVLVLNLIFVPTLLGQTQYAGDQFDAATVIDDHAVEFDRAHPANFVLSEWGENRMYNYFVSGESAGYGYARSTHEEFITGTAPDGWFEDFSGRVGYVVLTDRDAPEETVHGQLFDLETEGLAHYQLLYASDDVRAFAVVDGATIEATAETNETVRATSAVAVGDRQFTYERTATAGGNGTAEIRVAYPGEYEVGSATVTVTEQAVLDGERVRAER